MRIAIRMTVTEAKESDYPFEAWRREPENAIHLAYTPTTVHVRPEVVWQGKGALRDMIVSWAIPMHASHLHDKLTSWGGDWNQARYWGMLGEASNWKVYAEPMTTRFTFMSHGRISLLPDYGMVLCSITVEQARLWESMLVDIATPDGVRQVVCRPDGSWYSM